MRSYSVETREQAVVIFGGPAGLTKDLVTELEARGIHASKCGSLSELDQLSQDYDPDYLVFFDTPSDDLIPALTTLIQSAGATLFTVAHHAAGPLSLPFAAPTQVILYGDYVGAGELGSLLINDWLSQIESSRSLAIAGDGLGDTSLLAQSDLGALLALAIIHPKRGDSDPRLIMNPTTISHLNLAYLVRSALPYKIDLNFSGESDSTPPSIDWDLVSRELVELDYHLSENPEDLLRTYLSRSAPKPSQAPTPSPISPPTKPKPPEPKYKEPEPKKVAPTQPSRDLTPLRKLTPLRQAQPVFVPLQTKRPKVRLSLKWPVRRPRMPFKLHVGGVVGRGLIIGFALYLGTLAFASTIALLSLKNLTTQLQNEQLPSGNELTAFAVTYLQANWVAYSSLPVVSGRETTAQIGLLLDSYSQALSVFESADALSHTVKDLTTYVFGSSTADPVQLLSASRLETESLYQKLSLLEGALPEEPPSVLPDQYAPAYLSSKQKLTKIKRSIITARSLLVTAPDVIGLGGKRKYAVLFQNNMELRATGGFIGSLAILTFENGKLYDMPIFDVYDADGQLKGHVEPPAPIKDILGEANWYLRDSNFDPDFPTSARRAEWFIKKSLNQDLDGTIAVNVNTLVTLLEATGPLKIPDYDETITPANLYERAQFHAEVNFFPGSTQKKEFLSTVADTLFVALPSLSSADGLKLVAALSDSIQEKNTLISLTNPTSDQVFEFLGWNGKLVDLPCPSEDTCHKDYAMVVDSNFGVNKANYFIKRKIDQTITFDKDLAVTHNMAISYHNTSTSTAWPAGIYKNYQRLYLPIGTTISSIRVGDKELSSTEYQITSDHNRLVVAYLVSVPISSEVVVSVVYTTPQLPQDQDLLYTWYWQKQSGTSSSDELTVHLNYPMYLKPSIISPQAELAPQQLNFSMVNDTDRRLTVKFTR